VSHQAVDEAITTPRSRPTGPRRGSILRALAYVAVRDLRRRVQRLARRPLRLILIVGLLGGLGAAQVLAIAARDRTGVVDPTGALAAVGLLLIIGSISAVRRCPIRLRSADVAWLVPPPRGARSLLSWHLVAGAARVTVFGLVAGVIASVQAGTLTAVALQPALALPTIALTIRGFAFLLHLLTVRGVVRSLAGAIGVLIAAPLILRWLSSARADLDGLDALAAPWSTPARALLAAPLAAVRSPDATLWPGLLLAAVLAIGLAVLVITLGTGYQDEAAQRAWERESIATAYRDGSPLAGPVQELVAARLPAGVSSFTRLDGARGPAALRWRAIATLRRSWRWDLRPAAVLLIGAVVLAVLVAELALVAPITLLVLTLPGFRSGVVGELDHLAIRTIPGPSRAKLRAADDIPTAQLSVELALMALPALLVAGDLGALAGWLVVTPAIATAIVTSSTLVAVHVGGLGRRLALSALTVGATHLLLASSYLGARIALVRADVTGERALAIAVVIAVAAGWTLFARGWAARRFDRGEPTMPRDR
jgi:hypothetical protein